MKTVVVNWFICMAVLVGFLWYLDGLNSRNLIITVVGSSVLATLICLQYDVAPMVSKRIWKRKDLRDDS